MSLWSWLRLSSAVDAQLSVVRDGADDLLELVILGLVGVRGLVVVGGMVVKR